MSLSSDRNFLYSFQRFACYDSRCAVKTSVPNPAATFPKDLDTDIGNFLKFFVIQSLYCTRSKIDRTI